MLQKLSQLEPASRSVLLREAETHFWREADALPITADSLTEQIKERKALFDWQVQSKRNYLQNQLNTLQDQPETFRDEAVDVNINWSYVRAVVETAASELNWDVEISINTDENLIIVAVPEDQDDLIVETEFDFYSLIIKQLSKEIFKAINFFFI